MSMTLFVTRNLLEKILLWAPRYREVSIRELTPRNIMDQPTDQVSLSAVLYGEGAPLLPLAETGQIFTVRPDIPLTQVCPVMNAIVSVTKARADLGLRCDMRGDLIHGTGAWTRECVQLDAIAYTAAKAVHESNRAWCEYIGDDTQVHWEDAPDWVQESVLYGVKRIMDDPSTTPEQSHEEWCAVKRHDGWVYGKTKDATNKTHPCLLPYAELPREQKAKDHLFRTIVLGFIDFK